MRFLFVLEDGWFVQAVSVAVAKLRKLLLILAHEVHDVAQRLNGRWLATQHSHDDGAQLLQYRSVLRGLQRELEVHAEHLVAEHGELFGRHIVIGDFRFYGNRIRAQAQVVRPPMFGEAAEVGEVDIGKQRGGEPMSRGAVVPFRLTEQVRNQLLNGIVAAGFERGDKA